MRISDWSSDVCSSDLGAFREAVLEFTGLARADGATRALPLDGLTKRERAVLGLLCEGRRNAQIAWQLGVAEKTARNHVSNLFRQVGVRTRAQEILLAPEASLSPRTTIAEELREGAECVSTGTSRWAPYHE